MNSIMTAMLLTRGSNKSKIKTREVNLSEKKGRYSKKLNEFAGRTSF